MITKAELKNLIDVASGRKKADLLIKNCNVVDVYNGEILKDNVAISNGYIAGLGDYKADKIYDAKGGYVSPGLIDSHIHIESSYCTPEEFGKMVVPHGTTRIIADPHEIVNVCGLAGFDYMLEASKQTALSIKFMMPSCVPATKLEDSGAIIKASDMKDYMSNPNIPGLGEMMDFVAVENADDDVLDKITLAKQHGKIIDGHSPNVFGKHLNAYTAAGIKTDHECSTLEEMNDRLQKGMYVQLRQGSACHNLEVLAKGITDFNFRRCLLCSDDRQPKTIFEQGHLEHQLKKLVSMGINPIIAISMATSNVADCYNFDDIGVIAPGKKADIVIFDNLNDFNVKTVFINGEKIAENGIYLKKIVKADQTNVRHTMNIDFDKNRLKMHLKAGKVNAIEMIPGEVLTKKCEIEVNTDENGDFLYDDSIDVVKCAVLERHKNTGKVGLGFIKGYGMKSGAVAASVAHDSHNIICVGTDNNDMQKAIETVIDSYGGFAIAKNGHVLESLPLPIGGIMSDKSGKEVAEKLDSLHDIAVKELGVSDKIEPIMTLTFMSLIVIPELKITARGIFSVGENKFISLQ